MDLGKNTFIFLYVLKKLTVNNFALIDQLNIDFNKGLTIITGETGSGKSVLLGALQLLLGERADTSVLHDSNVKCIVEGVFEVSDYDLQDFFSQNDLDQDAVCILRREINQNGRSRAFINDTPVNLNQLRELGNMLVDIHAQHDTLLLETSSFQLKMLDSTAKNQNLLREYRKNFDDFKNFTKQLEEKKQQENQYKMEQDFFQFQYNEIKNAAIQAGEFEKLEEEFSVLTHAEEIRMQLMTALHIADGESGSGTDMLAGLKSLLNAIGNVSRYAADAVEINQRLKSLMIEFQDIIQELKILRDKTEAKPQRLHEISARMDLLNHLASKHRVNNPDEIILIGEELDRKLQQSDLLAEQIAGLEKSVRFTCSEMQRIASQISSKRREQIPVIEKAVIRLLHALGMPEAVFNIELIADMQPDYNGTDKVGISFSANAGSAPKDIRKVASGGELSRLMLALKKILATSVSLPTIIFDEIDTGVSGSLADSMGDVLFEMSENMQVIAITHLPQIASKGQDHHKVFKETISGVSYTSIRKLTPGERVKEIASMLSGKKLSDAALLNARNLLGIANE